MESLRADFVIVGSGIAGLRAAVELGPKARIVVLTKDAVAESATQYAQGGVAVALGDDDTVALHEHDTLAAGDGLCSQAAVRVLVEEGRAAIEQLLRWGAEFDRGQLGLERTREAAHSRSRVLHAHGDSTGRAMAETLAAQTRTWPHLRFLAHQRALRLLDDGAGRVSGVESDTARVEARAVLLATGGLGNLYAETTNPAIATGDGPALAYAAGAELADMEFVQFHPTALALAGAPRFLLSEALRGEGAVLRSPGGDRFMAQVHPAAELAPRDVVARALETQLRAAGADAVCYLDATGLGTEAATEAIERRFPRIAATLAHFGLSLGKDWIPIRPAAHYAMGGIATSLWGESTIQGLYAAGECACTGVHGANRLASNSLLEGLVFGARAGRAMSSLDAHPPAKSGRAASGDAEFPPLPPPNRGRLEAVQRVLSACAGVVRHGDDLLRGLNEAEMLGNATASAILRAAVARIESRGAHFRSDFPDHRDDLAGQHSFQSIGQPVGFRAIDGRGVPRGSATRPA